MNYILPTVNPAFDNGLDSIEETGLEDVATPGAIHLEDDDESDLTKELPSIQQRNKQKRSKTLYFSVLYTYYCHKDLHNRMLKSKILLKLVVFNFRRIKNAQDTGLREGARFTILTTEVHYHDKDSCMTCQYLGGT